MAPILSASIGITPQIIDDGNLRTLRKSLQDLEMKSNVPTGSTMEVVRTEQGDGLRSNLISVPVDIELLVSVLEPYQTWNFEEQVREKL
jgi:hypothetical protein